MSYSRLTWVESETPLSAQNMNNIEDGIEELQAQKVDKEAGKALSDNNYTTEEKTKLAGIEAAAEVNQNAFSNVKVGSTTVAADTKTDTLELVAGSNVTLTPDATNDKVTIAATDTTYSTATTSAAGLMSAADKTKLNGIAAGAEVNKSISSLVLTNSNTITFEAGQFSQITFVSAVTSNKPVVTGIREMKFINASNGASKLLTGGFTLSIGAATGGWKTSLTVSLWNPMNGDVTLDGSKSSITLAVYGD